MDAQQRTFTYSSDVKSASPLARLKSLLWMGADGELGQIAGRFIALVLGVLYAHLAFDPAVSEVSTVQAQARLAAYAYLAYLALALVLVLREGKASTLLRYANTIVDVNGVTMALYLGGAQLAPGVFLYLWAIAGNGFRYGSRFLYLGQVFAVAGFAILIFVSDYWSANWLGGLLLCAVVLIFLPLDFAVILEKIEDAKVAAETANRAKSGFLAVVSHEMRTPLNVILGIADLMRDTRLEAEQRTLLDTLGRSAAELQHLVTNVLDLAQIEANKLRVQLERVDYSALVAETTGLFLFEAARKGIVLRVIHDRGGKIVLQTDPRLVRQILINLIGNAIKFTDRGSVEVFVAQDTHIVHTEIRDTGCGIPEAFQKRLFEAFAQADQSAQRRYGGTGLGTTISQQLVRLLGGTIGFSSATNEGSTFWFELPSSGIEERSEPWPDDDLAMTPQLGGAPARALDILVVEDNEATRFVLSRVLGGAGHKVHCVADGQSALTALEAGVFDVALVDMEMPDVSGVEVITRHRAGHPHSCGPAFVMLTASVTADLRQLALSSGAVAFLSKPVTRQVLFQTLDAVAGPERLEGVARRSPRADAQIVARARTFADDPNFSDALIEAFLNDMSANLPKLQQAIANLDWERIAEHAHALRGSALDAGVPSVAQICHGVEHHAGRHSAAQLHSALSELQRYATAIRASTRQEGRA